MSNIKQTIRSLKLWQKVVIACVMAIVCLFASVVLACYFVIPGIIKSTAQSFAHDKFNRKLVIKQIDINPFALSVNVEGLALYDPNGATTKLFQFDRLYIDVSGETLTSFHPVVKEIKLENPVIAVFRNKERQSNVRDIITYFLKPKEDTGKTYFAIHNIQLQNGKITVDDEARNNHLKIEELNISLPFLANIQSNVDITINFGISAKINDDKVSFVSKTKTTKDQSRGGLATLQIEKLDIPTYMHYLPIDYGFQLKSGKFTAEMDVDFGKRESGKRPISVDGQLLFESIVLAEANGKDVLSIPRIAIQFNKSDVMADQLVIDDITVEKPHLYVDCNKEGQTNIDRLIAGFNDTQLMKRPGAQNAPVAKQEEKPKDSNKKQKVFNIKRLRVNNASADVENNLFTKPIYVNVRDFNVDVKDALVDLGQRTVRIDHIASQRTQINIVHSMSEVFEQYIEWQEKQTAKLAVQRVAQKTGFEIYLNHVRVQDWSMQFENKNNPLKQVMRITKINASTDNISDKMDHSVPLEITAKINEDSSLMLKGNLRINPLLADLNMEIRRFDVRFIQPYINDYVNVSLNRAELWVRGHLCLSKPVDGLFNGTFKGKAAVGNLHITDQVTHSPLMSWKDLIFEDVAVNLNPFKAQIEKIRLNHLNARLILSSQGRLNLQDILRQEKQGAKSLVDETDDAPAPTDTVLSKPENPSPQMKRLDIQVNKLLVNNGTIRFTDNFIRPRFMAHIKNIKGAVFKLKNDPDNISLMKFSAQVNNAPLTVEGYIKPLAHTITMNASAHIKGMELAQLSAYAKKYIGYGIEKGKLSYQAKYNLQAGKLSATNTLMLDQLTLGPRDETSDVSLPVELALSLLKDDSGVIKIDVPISGSLDSPEFSLSDVIGQATGGMLKKVVTAPFAFLLSSSEKEHALKKMTFAAGSSNVTKDNINRLKKMAQGISKHPKLKLEITGFFDEADRAVIGEVTLKRKLRLLKMQKNKMHSLDDVTVTEREYNQYLPALYKKEVMEKPEGDVSFEQMRALLTAHYEKDDANLVYLAKQRAQEVKTRLVVHGLDEEKIYLLAEKKTSGASDDTPCVTFNLRWRN